MSRTPPARSLTLLAFTLCAAGCSPVQNTQQGPPVAVKGETHMIQHAKGTFDVTLKPLDMHQKVEGPSGTLGRRSIDKVFRGDIEGTSVGEMLSGMGGPGVKGSAGYVAIERVTGSIAGRKGSFILQHMGTMNRGTPQLSVVVVPDSGTDELAGLSGTFSISIVGGVHEYDLAYTLPPRP